MKLKYYCETCGNKVPKDVDICPHCGRYFTAVKCPVCGYEGNANTFVTGCPRCSHLADGSTVSAQNVKAVDPVPPKKKNLFPFSSAFYRIAALGLLIMLIIFLYLLFNI